MNYKKPHYVQFGPPIELVSVSDFSRFALTKEQFEEAWAVVGPSAERNMRRDYRGRCLEMWQVITAAYLEGLHHGSEMMRENLADSSGVRALGNKS